jgi:hypothetical protein
MTLTSLLIQPFADYGFMRRALVATFALALGSAPIGTLLVLRRMSLVGDAMAHALLPGAALGFLIAGFSLAAMSIGGFIAALGVALAAGFVTRATAQREDASFAAFYLIALALGVLLVSTHGSSVDLMHVLFGTILAVDDAALLLMAGVGSVSLLPRVSSQCGGAWPTDSHAVPRTYRCQPRRRLSGAGHAHGGRLDDAAGHRCTLLGQPSVGFGASGNLDRPVVRFRGPAALISC